jgi:hypothetical protein
MTHSAVAPTAEIDAFVHPKSAIQGVIPRPMIALVPNDRASTAKPMQTTRTAESDEVTLFFVLKSNTPWSSYADVASGTQFDNKDEGRIERGCTIPDPGYARADTRFHLGQYLLLY